MPFAASAASTRAAAPRKSEAITGAARNSFTPRTSAEEAVILISAPIRASSETCMNRFSKIVSSTKDEPSAILINAMNCACISVGKPGCGRVEISTPLIISFFLERTRPFSSLISKPIAASFSTVASMSERGQFSK